jgi:periplasmic protein TonB
VTVTSISVSRMLQLRLLIAWQEAVELSRAAEQAATRAGVPLSLENCVLSVEGTVHVNPVPSGSPGAPLTVLEFLALVLQDQAAPPELRALLASRQHPHPEVPPDETAAGRAVDLNWFASPRPELDIARLATRAVEAAAEHDARAAIERLRVEASEAPDPTPVVPSGRTQPQSWRQPLGIGLTAVLLAAAGVAIHSFVTHAPAPTSEAEAEAPAAAATSLVSAAVDAMKRALAPEGSVAAVTNRTLDDDPNAVASPATPARRAAPLTAPAAALTWSPAAAAEPLFAPEPPDVAADVPPPASSFGESASRVFSIQDGDVEPPAFLHPQLPSGLDGSRSQREPHMELMVDEHGHVRQVRLRGDGTTLNDRMIVSAAKAWRFRPALKDGQPVPYVLRVPVPR